jgi:hypothetical protein
MKTIRTTPMLRASAIGATFFASLALTPFVGAGTAQAATNPAYFSNQDGSLEVIYGGGGLALYATIVDARNSEGAPEVCHYHSVGVMNTPALPYDADTTVTGPHPSAPVTIIFQSSPAGTTAST